MTSSAARVSFKLALAVLLLLLASFFVGRPLYWKLSATIHENMKSARSDKPFNKLGISHFVLEAKKSVGWGQDESDSGAIDDREDSINHRFLRGCFIRKYLWQKSFGQCSHSSSHRTRLNRHRQITFLICNILHSMDPTKRKSLSDKAKLAVNWQLQQTNILA